MNPSTKEQLIKGGLSLAAIAATIAVLPTAAGSATFDIVKPLLAAIAPNWAAQFSAEALMPWVKKKWLSNPDPLIKNHINNALISSWKMALDQVLKEYKEHSGGKPDRPIRDFIAALKDISDQDFLTSLHGHLEREEPFGYLSADNIYVDNGLDQQPDLPQDFIVFFKERTPKLMSLYFRAELEQGKEAKQAMDLLYQETIRKTIQLIGKTQQEQLSILADIRTKIDKLPGTDTFNTSRVVDCIASLDQEMQQGIVALQKDTAEIISLIKVRPFLARYDEIDNPDLGTLFSYKQQYTTLAGREEELSLLHDFIDDREMFRWMVITGPGGIGKSRLALEYSHIAETKGYHAGFLNASMIFNWQTWVPSIDTFIVIDYAFADHEAVLPLIELLKEKTARNESSKKIRVLLLDREIRVDIKKGINTNDAVRNSNFLAHKPEKFYELKSLEHAARWHMIKEIINKSDLSPDRKTELIDAEKEIMVKLDEFDPKKRPLFAFFTGIALIQEEGFKKIESWNANNLIEHHLERLETKVWKKGKGYAKNEWAIKKLILVNTICRELSPKQILKVADFFRIDIDYIQNEYPLLSEVSRNKFGFAEKYYGIQPDILGEYFIVLMFMEFSENPLRDEKELLELYQLSVELNLRTTSHTFTLLNQDFFSTDYDALIDMQRERIVQYDELIKVYPDNYFYFSERGALKYNTGLHEDALADLDRSIELRAENNISYFFRGMVKLKLDRAEESLGDLDIAVAMYPDWSSSFRYRGMAKYELGRNEEAIADFDKAIALDDKDSLTYNNKGNALHDLKRYEEAIENYNKAIAIAPKDFQLYRNRANTKLLLQKYQEAIEDYSHALAIDQPQAGAETFNDRGDIKHTLKRYDEAIEDYSKAIELAPDIAVYRFNRGITYKDKGQFELAVADYDKAVEQVPEKALYYEARAAVKIELKMYEEAIADCNKAISLSPNDDKNFIHRGMAKYYSGKYDVEDAIADHDRALELGKSAYAYFRRGAFNWRIGRFPESIADYDQAIALEPDNVVYHYNRSTVNSSLKKHHEAITDLTRAIELDPKDDSLYTARGDVYFTLGNYTEAIVNYDRAIELAPDSDVLWLNKGLANRKMGDHEQAIIAYHKAIELNPVNATLHMNLGIAKHFSGKYSYGEVIADLNKAIELKQSANTYSERASIHSYAQKFEEALADYDIAVSLEPDNPSYYYYRAGAKESLDDTAGAIADYDKAIQLNPNSGIYYEGRANIYHTIRKYPEAIADCSKAIECDPNRSSPWLNRGLANRRMGNYDQAIADYDKAIELAPDNASIYLNRGIAKQFSRKYSYEEIIADLDKAIGLNPSARNYYERGSIKRMAKRFEEALTDYDMAISIDPDNPLFYFYRADTKLALGSKPQEAIADYDIAIQLDPGDYVFYQSRASVYFELENYAQAIVDYNKAIEYAPNVDELWLDRGLAYRRMGNNEQAIADYDKAIELRADNPTYYLNRGIAKLFSQKYAHEEVIADIDKAIELKPSAQLYAERGSINYGAQKFDQSLADYDMALTLQPNSATHYFYRARTKIAMLAHEDAIADYSKALEIAPDHRILYFSRGKASFSIRRFEETVNDMQAAIKIDPQYGEAYHLLGKAYFELSEARLAHDALTEAVKLGEEAAQEDLKILFGNDPG